MPKAKHRTKSAILTIAHLPALELAGTGSTIIAARALARQQSYSGPSRGSALFRHSSPGILRILNPRVWTKNALGPLQEVLEIQRLVFAADNPILLDHRTFLMLG